MKWLTKRTEPSKIKFQTARCMYSACIAQNNNPEFVFKETYD